MRSHEGLTIAGAMFFLLPMWTGEAASLIRVPDDFSSINDALVFAQAGDTVGVREGTYSDSFTPKNGVAVLGGYNFNFTSRDPAQHVTTLTSTGRVVSCPKGGVGPTTIIDGFTMTGGGGDAGGLVFLISCSPVVSHCRFVGATGGRGGGVYLVGSSSFLFENEFVGCSSSEVGGGLAIFDSNGTLVRNCRFEDNESASSGGAVFTNNSSGLRFAGCVFIENQSGASGGALLLQLTIADVDSCVFARNVAPGSGGAVGAFASPAFIDQCTVVANEASAGGGIFGSNEQVTVTHSIVVGNSGYGLQRDGGVFNTSCNDVWNNSPADYAGVSPGPDTISSDPLFCNAAGDDWTLELNSPCAPDNSPCGLMGALPATCPGLIIRVPDDYSTILFAINAAEGGDIVAVAEGHYPEHVTLKNNVKVLGGWRSDFAARDPLAYPSVIDAGGFLSAVVAQNGEGPNTILDGFVITGGNNAKLGGGVYCFGSSPTIRNNVFRDNRAGRGAGIGSTANSTPVITGNVFVDNVALDSPGGAIYVEGTARIEGNTLDGNEGPLGSGIVARAGAQPVVTRNIVVHGRVGVGIYADQGAVPATSCNDVWQNAGGDYFGVLPGPDSFSLDPRFCTGEDRFLAEDSPCAPENAPSACSLIGARGVGCAVTAVGPSAVALAPSWLGAISPNPVRAGPALIEFGLAEESAVRLAIFDVAGRRVRTLVEGIRPAGEHRARWDGRSDRGGNIPSGIYLYELTAGGERVGRRKMVVVY